MYTKSVSNKAIGAESSKLVKQSSTRRDRTCLLLSGKVAVVPMPSFEITFIGEQYSLAHSLLYSGFESVLTGEKKK